MRILQLNLEKGWRGGERQTLLTARAQRDLGHDVELMVRARSELARRSMDEGFKVHYARNAISLASRLAMHGSDFDIIHAQTAGSVTGAVLSKPFHRRPVVFSRRTDFPVSTGERFTKFKWQHIDQLVAISQSAAAEPRRFGIEPLIIPSATLAIKPAPDRVKKFLDDSRLHGKRLIGTSAVLNIEKDPLTLIKAAAHVCHEQHDVVFLHWGAEGSSAQAARALIKELNLEDQYLLLGFQKSPEQLYPILSGFVLCSAIEALGSSLLDAMSQQVPVIGTHTGGIKDLLSSGRGLVSPVGDAQALAQNILWVLNNPQEAKAMADLAHAFVQREHDVQRMGQRYLDLYERLLNQVTRRLSKQ
jgi:glycosyltransferase involved in cell wall biosynthesis